MSILKFIGSVMLLTLGQLISILGVFFFFGFILYLLARFTRVSFVKSIGQRFDIYFTGWIGTPIHELGHAIFCIPFGHKIVELKLFKPNSSDGSLGYVNHSYNPNNIWHRIGNFFIGFGPILFGSFVLYLLIKYLVPDNEQVMQLINSQQNSLNNLNDFLLQIKSLYSSSIAIFHSLFSSENIHSWQFWLFMYLALAISSHMELSPPDLKSVWSGFVSIIILLLILNSISVFFNIDATKISNSLGRYSSITAGVFVFASFVSALFFISSFFILNIYTLIRYKKSFHPFA